jgi:hypothetical protein
MDHAHQRLETGPQSLRHSIRGPLATLTPLTKTAFTQKI